MSPNTKYNFSEKVALVTGSSSGIGAHNGALELGPKGIRVNSINPGPVVTPFGFPVGYGESLFNDFFDQMTSKSLMKRVGQPEDIARLASFLASDDARNITGSIHVTDSGALVSGQDL